MEPTVRRYRPHTNLPTLSKLEAALNKTTWVKSVKSATFKTPKGIRSHPIRLNLLQVTLTDDTGFQIKEVDGFAAFDVVGADRKTLNKVTKIFKSFNWE